MSDPQAPRDENFVAAFMDDYYAECDEHFALLRRSLLALEHAAAEPASQAALLEELFRSVHSLKGISAMVELVPAERLAHELESLLSALQRQAPPVSPEAVSMLIDGTGLLERVVAARRERQPPPPIDPVLTALEGLTAQAHSHPAPPAESVDAQTVAGEQSRTWIVTFVPSPELVARGIKVDTVRARLGAIGRLVSATPRVLSGGGIAFEFQVVGPADETVFASWRDDGLSWAPAGAAVPDAGERGPAERPSAAAAGAALLGPSHFVRVDLKRLDEVMRRIADLVVTRARLEEGLGRLGEGMAGQAFRRLQETSLTMERQLRDLREDVMRIRLVRVDEVFRRMPFVARDLSRETGREVRLVLRGQETEIDKYLVERLMDPVLHLVRNAVSHGIEPAEVRRTAGKPLEGTVTLSAVTAGDSVVIEVADDGAGLDPAHVVERARAAGLVVPSGPVDGPALLDLLCAPGFSTRQETDRASGRGMGMAVVRKSVEEIGGALALESEAGRGTSFRMTLPLTLAITDALIAVVGGQTFAVPQGAVREVIEVDMAAVRRLENHELLPYRGGALPLVRVDRRLGLSGEERPRRHAFVVGNGPDAVGLLVDRIVGQREIVVRALTDALTRIEGVSGATELGDGRVVLILDMAALSRGRRPLAIGQMLRVAPAAGLQKGAVA